MNKLHPSTRALGALKDGFVTRFKAFVAHPRFPCVGAKSALNRGRMHFGLYDTLSGDAAVRTLCEQLADFSGQFPQPGSDPVSYVAMFRDPVANEDEFHRQLWTHLQAMHDIDSERHGWDPAVSSVVDDAHFSFSIASRAFFVVGLHPHASRLARRAPFPCLVFNFHDQFEAMRHDGRYTKLQDAIRARDIALQGAINPVLARFGESSEAHQYSGRAALDTNAGAFQARQAA